MPDILPLRSAKVVDRDIYGVMPYVRPGGTKGMLKKSSFVYDEHHDCYLCPEAQVLEYSTTNRDGYREYTSNPQLCGKCPRLKECTQSRNCTKVVTRHVWEEEKEQTIEHRYEERGKRIYKRRKETVERSFADAKELHGHRYARMRGIAKVSEQCLLSATAQNIKKMALILSRKRNDGPLTSLRRLYGALCVRLRRFFINREKNRIPDFAPLAAFC